MKPGCLGIATGTDGHITTKFSLEVITPVHVSSKRRKRPSRFLFFSMVQS